METARGKYLPVHYSDTSLSERVYSSKNTCAVSIYAWPPSWATRSAQKLETMTHHVCIKMVADTANLHMRKIIISVLVTIRYKNKDISYDINVY